MPHAHQLIDGLLNSVEPFKGEGGAFLHVCDDVLRRSRCHLIFPIRRYGFRRPARGPGSIDYSRPTNHADRHLRPEPTLAFNSADHNASVHVQSRKRAVKHPAERAGPTTATWISTTCMRNLHTHTHRNLLFRPDLRRFLKLSLFLCVHRRLKQLKVLEGNANDRVSSQANTGKLN